MTLRLWAVAAAVGLVTVLAGCADARTHLAKVEPSRLVVMERSLQALLVAHPSTRQCRVVNLPGGVAGGAVISGDGKRVVYSPGSSYGNHLYVLAGPIGGKLRRVDTPGLSTLGNVSAVWSGDRVAYARGRWIVVEGAHPSAVNLS